MKKPLWTLEQLLPHRGPMLLLNDVLHCEHDRVDTRVIIHEKCSFFDDSMQGVPVWIGIEYMAQTIGVWEGYRKLCAQETVESAFLLGVRDFCTDGEARIFQKNSELAISAIPVIYDEEKRLGVFDCTIISTEIRCQARINAFSPLNPRKFIEALRDNERSF